MINGQQQFVELNNWVNNYFDNVCINVKKKKIQLNKYVIDRKMYVMYINIMGLE